MPDVKLSDLSGIIQHFADSGELDYTKKMPGAFHFSLCLAELTQ